MTAEYMRKLELDLDVAKAIAARLEFERDNLRMEVYGYSIALGQINDLAQHGDPITVAGRRYVVDEAAP